MTFSAEMEMMHGKLTLWDEMSCCTVSWPIQLECEISMVKWSFQLKCHWCTMYWMFEGKHQCCASRCFIGIPYKQRRAHWMQGLMDLICQKRQDFLNVETSLKKMHIIEAVLAILANCMLASLGSKKQSNTHNHQRTTIYCSLDKVAEITSMPRIFILAILYSPCLYPPHACLQECACSTRRMMRIHDMAYHGVQWSVK